MTARPQFHKGQEVGVLQFHNDGTVYEQKATIVHASTFTDGLPSGYYTVRFSNGSHAFMDAGHIRAIEDPLETAARYLNQGGTIEGELP